MTAWHLESLQTGWSSRVGVAVSQGRVKRRRRNAMAGEGHRGGVRRGVRSHGSGRHFRRDYTPGPRWVKGKSGTRNGRRNAGDAGMPGRPQTTSSSGAVARCGRLAVCSVLQRDGLLAVRADDLSIGLDITLICRRASAAGRAMYGEIHVLTPVQNAKSPGPGKSRPLD